MICLPNKNILLFFGNKINHVSLNFKHREKYSNSHLCIRSIPILVRPRKQKEKITINNKSIAVGNSALLSNSDGNNNAALGLWALYSNTGSNNVAVGHSALYSADNDDDNTAIGYQALYDNSNNGNTAVGYRAAYQNSNGSLILALGNSALYNNTTGSSNTASGFEALYNNDEGSYNSAFGVYALREISHSIASENTAVGYKAGYYFDQYSNKNTVVGCEAGPASPLAYFYNTIAIGYNAHPQNNKEAVIGNTALEHIGGYVGWTNYSDSIHKRNVKENVPGIKFIKKLKPITYTKSADLKTVNPSVSEDNKQEIEFSGFIASEVDKAAKQLNYNFSGIDKSNKGIRGIRYATFVVPLVKAVQEQQKMIDGLNKQNTNLENKVNELEQQINEIKAALK